MGILVHDSLEIHEECLFANNLQRRLNEWGVCEAITVSFLTAQDQNSTLNFMCLGTAMYVKFNNMNILPVHAKWWTSCWVRVWVPCRDVLQRLRAGVGVRVPCRGMLYGPVLSNLLMSTPKHGVLSGWFSTAHQVEITERTFGGGLFLASIFLCFSGRKNIFS